MILEFEDVMEGVKKQSWGWMVNGTADKDRHGPGKGQFDGLQRSRKTLQLFSQPFRHTAAEHVNVFVLVDQHEKTASSLACLGVEHVSSIFSLVDVCSAVELHHHQCSASLGLVPDITFRVFLLSYLILCC